MYNNIQFKSQLEVMVYKTLLQEGFKPEYEPMSYKLWVGYKPEVPYYTKDNKTRLQKLDDKKVIDIKYTPDFILHYNGIRIIIECKGFQNDTYYLKKKLFRNYLEYDYKNVGIVSIFFEIYTKKQLMQAIDIIKNYAKTD